MRHVTNVSLISPAVMGRITARACGFVDPMRGKNTFPAAAEIKHLDNLKSS
jgi:hypothetical protein